MNSRLTASAALMTVLIASGCASTEGTDTKPAQPAELVYRTGSNLPVPEPRPTNKEEKDKQAEDAQRMLTRPTGSAGSYKSGG